MIEIQTSVGESSSGSGRVDFECQSDGNSNKRRPSCLVAQRTPADSQKEKEASKANCAGYNAAKKQEKATVRIETNSQQGDLGVEVDSVEGDLAETENSFAGDEASSEWEERQKGRVESPQLMRRFLWPCDSTCTERCCGWLSKATAMQWFFSCELFDVVSSNR